MDSFENRTDWSKILYGPDQIKGFTPLKETELPADQELASVLCNEMQRRGDCMVIPIHLKGSFSELSSNGQRAWKLFIRSIPLKLSSLDLGIRKFKESFTTCIITDDEIEKLARYDYRNQTKVQGALRDVTDDFEERSEQEKDFYRELNFLIPYLLKEHAYEVFRPGDGLGIDECMMKKLARAMHAMYIAEIRRSSAATKRHEHPSDWDSLSEEARASNLDSARHIHTKLWAIGYKIGEVQEGYQAATLELDEEEVETMARIEHLRWCWEKRAMGWMRGSETDVEQKVHASLVPYTLLSDSDKGKDRALVRMIPALLQDLNYEAIPVGKGRISRPPYAIRPESAVQRLLRLTRELKEEIAHLDLVSEQERFLLDEKISKIGSTAHELNCSYEYAKHIQGAFMPDELRVRESFPDSFILYRPRDVVSGDFYYFNTRQSISIFAAADCTGHGIPGALLSTIAYGYIDQAVGELEIQSPSFILRHLYSRIHKFLRRYEEGSYLYDDLDIALCTYDHDTRLLRFAAERNPIFHIDCDTNKLMKYKTLNQYQKADQGNVLHYEELEISLKPGDLIYTGSDGFIDQFGGEPRKRFGTSRLRKLLQEISPLSMPRQKEKLEFVMQSWKDLAKEEQTDDILMMGIRI